MRILLFLLVPAIAVAAPFKRTETRDPCDNYVETRQPFFGELHLHTSYSLDARTTDTRNTPRDAYRFAKGEEVGVPPFFDRCRYEDMGKPGCPSNGGTGPVTEHPYCIPPYRCDNVATRTVQHPPGRSL